MIIHINGWPGVGKLSVAREVAHKLGARLLDSHVLHDVAGRLCDRGTDEYWELYYQVRDVAYGRVRALPSNDVLVMTNALLRESPREVEAWSAVEGLARDRSDRLVAVTLECSIAENVRRLRSEERLQRKLADPELLMEWRSKYTLLTTDSEHSLTIDNSDLSADQAADKIVAVVQTMN